MTVLRSILFNIAFYTWGAIASLLMSPTLLISRRATYVANQIWIKGVFGLMTHVMGIHLEVRGRENISTRPCIYASKHQSALETMVFHHILHDPAIVLKRELMWIPFFGWYFQRLGMIPISRDKTKGSKSLRDMLKACQVAIDRNQPIVIFPEGTRSAPGITGKYQSGVASIYSHLKIPVVPVALNSGTFWPRRGFLKKPGTVVIDFLDEIPPGLSRQEFMTMLESRIETRTITLEKQVES